MKVRIVTAATKNVMHILYVATEGPNRSLLGLTRFDCRPYGAGTAGMEARIASSGMVPLIIEVLVAISRNLNFKSSLQSQCTEECARRHLS